MTDSRFMSDSEPRYLAPRLTRYLMQNPPDLPPCCVECSSGGYLKQCGSNRTVAAFPGSERYARSWRR